MRSKLNNLLKMVDNSAAIDWPISYEIVAKCSTSRARCAKLTLPHAVVDTPVFMPVGTQGTVKGMMPEQLEDCQIILGNTYHLGHRPGHEIVEKAGGLHRFMNWKKALLTDSGGFQMVSLSKLMSVEEEGVRFESPHTKEMMLLSPEHSIGIQRALGADIVMQLDDVVHSSVRGERVREAMQRSIRWLDRCIAAMQTTEINADPPAMGMKQNLFAIVQGGLDADLRRECLQEMVKRDVAGFAIGGLSGGEAKDDFWRMVRLCTDFLPDMRPRYCMGVGWAEDLVVCSALGVDMYDCVFPTRTARFGSALQPPAPGHIQLRLAKYKDDFGPLCPGCECSTCQNYSRSYLNSIATHHPIASHLLTTHNLFYMLRLMANLRAAIRDDRFPEFVRAFMLSYYPQRNFPRWIVDALDSVNIRLHL